MSSISLFYSTFTGEREIRELLAAASGFIVIHDADLIAEVCRNHQLRSVQVEQALYSRTSVFNKFTLERERIAAYLKEALAGHLHHSEVLCCGFISQLIPPEITHLLKVGIFDEKANRLQRALAEGLSEKSALKIMKRNDLRTTDWTDFLYKKMAGDPSLYDIVIPVKGRDPESISRFILDNFRKPALLETEVSRQAIDDMALAARAELALIDKGYTPDIQSHRGKITLLVNKSVHNFAKLADTMSAAVNTVTGVQDVEVAAGKDYHVSVYRGQEFELPPKVLLVDDEHEFVQTLSDRLNTRNYGSVPVFDGEQALDILDSETPDVMVLDLKMPGVGGVEVLRQTKESHPGIEIIILTGHGSADVKKVCMEIGAFAYLHKPVDIAELTAVIDKAYEKVAADRVSHA